LSLLQLNLAKDGGDLHLPSVGHLLLHLVDGLQLGDLLQTTLAWKLKDCLTASWITNHYRALVQLDGWARVGPGGQHAPPLMHLVTFKTRKQYLLVNAGLYRLGQFYHNLLDDRVQDRGQVADVPVLLHTVGGGSIASWGMVRVYTDGVVCTGLLPLHIHQLSFCLHRHEGEGVGAHLIVNNLLRLGADCFGYLIAFLLLLDHEAILNIFSLTISLKRGHTDLSFLLHIVYSTLLPVILNTRAMGAGLCVGAGVLVGWSSLLVVDIGFG